MLLLPSHNTILQKCEKHKACKQIENKVSKCLFFSELHFLQHSFNGEFAYLHTGLIPEKRADFSMSAASLIFAGGGDYMIGFCWFFFKYRSVFSVFHHYMKLRWLEKHSVFLLQWKQSTNAHRTRQIWQGMFFLNPLVNYQLN